MSTGEYRVGVDFNPSGNADVKKVKYLAAALIDAINEIRPYGRPNTLAKQSKIIAANEVERLKDLAKTNAEESAMWAVKAATKPEFCE